MKPESRRVGCDDIEVSVTHSDEIAAAENGISSATAVVTEVDDGEQYNITIDKMALSADDSIHVDGASLMKRSRSTRDRERKDRIKVDLDEIRNMLPKSATDKKLPMHDLLQHALDYMRSLIYENKLLGGDGCGDVRPDTEVDVDEFMRLKKENEQLKSENIRFQSIIDNAGIPPHIDPAELVVTWRLRTHAEMFSSSDGSALEPVSQSDTVTSQHYEQYGQQPDDTGGDAGCVFTELLSAAEFNAPSSSAQPVQRPNEQQNGLMSCIVPSGLMYPNSGPASMPFLNQNGQLVFLPPAPTNARNMPLLQPSVSCADNHNLTSSVSHVSTTQCTDIAGETECDMPAVSSSTEEHSEPPNVSAAEETDSVAVEPADSSVTESSLAPVDSLPVFKPDNTEGDGQNAESASHMDGIEPVSPATDVPDETKDEMTIPPSNVAEDHVSTSEQLLFTSTQQSSLLNSGVVQQQHPQFASQPQMSVQQPFATQQPAPPMGMMQTVQNDSSVQGSSMQGTLVLHNGQLLLVNQNQPAQPLPASGAVNAVGPTVSPNMAVSGSGTIFVNQFPPQPPQQQPAIAPPVPPLAPNQTVMVNTPSGPMTLNTVPSQPNQHPSALILPNGQIVPVVTQPNLLFPPQQCTPVTGGLLIPTPPSQPMVNFVPPVSASPRMSSFTTTPIPAPVVTVAAGNVPGAGMVRGLVQVPAGQQTGFPGSQPVQVGPGSVIQAVPAQGHVPVQMSSQSAAVSGSTATATGPRASVPNLPQTVMATMTPEGTIILTMPQTETQQKASGKTKKSTVPRPLMPKPTITASKTDGMTPTGSVATTALNFLTPARLPSIASPTSSIMPMMSGATYMVTNGPTVAGPNLSLAPLSTVTHNSSIAPLAVSVATDMVSHKNSEVTKATDILAKATESIFMLSPSSTEHLSPGGLCLNATDNQLQIDVDGTVEHAAQSVKPNAFRSRSKKKPKMPMSFPPGAAEEIAADHAAAHSILDQLEGGEGDDEQSDINDFSDLIRLEPMTPRPAVVVAKEPAILAAKETSVEDSSKNIDEADNSVVDSVEVVDSCSVMAAPLDETDLTLQDSDDEEVVEIDLTEEPISPDPHVVIAEEPALPDVELDSVNVSEREPLSSSSKTLFERLEEALMSSSTAVCSSSSVTSSVSTALTASMSSRKSSRNAEKVASSTTESSRGNEMSTADRCCSSSMIDRIGKVLTMDKKSHGADHRDKKLLSTAENMTEDEHVVKCRTESIVGTSTPVDQSNSASIDNSSDVAVTINPNTTVAVEKSVSEVMTEKRHKRSKRSKEKPSEPVVTDVEHAAELDLSEKNVSKKYSAETDAVSVDGKHKGFALSNFLPESTKLNESTSAADLLEQSLCMATDDRQKNRSLNASADESADVIISDGTFETAEVPCTVEETTQSTRKEQKKDKSKKQSHKSSCNGIAASEMPDTLTFSANELLNIVDVVENMAVETQMEKKTSHHRKHKTSSSGDVEVPSKRKKKSRSSLSKHENVDSDQVEKPSTDDSIGIAAGERERHSKHKTDSSANCPRSAMAPKNDPMDVFNFTSDDTVPMDVVSSYSPYRNVTKKLADESTQGHVNTAKLPTARSNKSSGADKLLNNIACRSSEPTKDGHSDVPQVKTVQSENKENRGTHKKLGHGSDEVDVMHTPPHKHEQTMDMADSPADLVSAGSGERQSAEEVSSKSITARHSNIATLARHVVPPKVHGSTPRSTAKVSAQAARNRNEPEAGDNDSETINTPVQAQSPPVRESLTADNQNTMGEHKQHFDNTSFTDFSPGNANEPVQAVKTINSTAVEVGFTTAVTTVASCQCDTLVTSQSLQVTVASSSSANSLSRVSPVPSLPSTNGVVSDTSSKAHAASAVSSCAVNRSESQPYVADGNNPIQSCSHEGSGTVADASSRSYVKNSIEIRGETISAGYVDLDENTPGRSSSVSSQSNSMRHHSADVVGYEHGTVDRGYCENYSAGRSQSSGGSCSVEGHSVSSAQVSLHCDRAINSASVNSLNSSSSLRSNCSQKMSTTSDGRNSRSSAASHVAGMYGSNMDCSAGTKHRSSCQEDSRQRQMIESEFFVPRAASSSSCALQSKIATSVIEPFQYPYAAMNGAQPQPHHHEMSLASLAAAEYGFGRNPFSSFPSPFGFDPQPPIRGPPGRFSPLSYNLPSCGVDKQTHKSAAGNSMRSGQESSTDMSKSRQHQQQNMPRDGYTSNFGHCTGSGTGQFLEPMPKDGMGSTRSSGHRLSSGSSSSAQNMSTARRSRSPAVADRSNYVGFGGLANSLTSPPLHHPPSTMPDRQCSARASSTGFELTPSYHSPAAGTQFSPNLTSVGFDPPPLNYSSVRDCASVGMAPGHSSGGMSKKTDKDSKQQQGQGALQHKSPAAVAPAPQQPTKSSSNRSSSSSSKSQKKSSGKSASQTAPGLPVYDLDPSMFDSRCMTPYFGLGGGVSPNRGSLQGVQPSAADSLSYFSANIFGGPGRPLSNAAAKTLQHHRDAANPFSPFSPAGRATANGLGGLNFQPATHGFGMEAHMAAAAAAPMMPHTPSAPGFGFGSLFADVGGVANMSDQHSTISPIKFPHHGASAQDPLHHQPTAYGGRAQHMLHDMGFNALLGGHHQHPSGAFDARAISSAMGPPFAGHHAAASFGMGALNFPMHNL